MTEIKSTVLVTGGAGYVGSGLVPQLLDLGYTVKVLDLYIYGDKIFGDHHKHPNLREIKGDLRHPLVVKNAVADCNHVIHLACISNDPSFDLNPDLGKSINYDAFQPLVKASKEAGVERFIYASSSSVYGIKKEQEVTEELSLEPLTDYSKYKAMCEDILQKEREPGFCAVTIRPSTVCGYARRLRLDVIVNLMTNAAVNNKEILVTGGSQMRPNIHIQDMVGLYLHLLQLPAAVIDGGVYNAGYENLAVMRIAELVRDTLSNDANIVVKPTDDLRSYHVSSELMEKELGFSATHTVEDAIRDLNTAFNNGNIPDPTQSIYRNIERMKEIELS